jgi:hypothetical protein
MFIPPPKNKELTKRLLNFFGRPGSISYIVGMKWANNQAAPESLVVRIVKSLEALNPQQLERAVYIDETKKMLQDHIDIYVPKIEDISGKSP